MNQKNAFNLLIVLATIALAGWFLKDSIIYYSKSPAAREEYIAKNPTIFKRIFNLGLDLQGGMRMVLEIDRSKLDADAQKDVLDRAYTIIENRVNGLGVAEPTIQKQGTDRIIVELPGLRDETQAKEVIGSTAQLEFKLLREPAELVRAIGVVDNVIKGKTDSSVVDTTDTTAIKKKEQEEEAQKLFQGSAEDTGKTKSDSSALAQGKKITSFSSLLIQAGEQIGVQESNKADVEKILARPDVKLALEKAGLGANQFLWSHEVEQQGASRYRILYYVKGRAELKGDAINDASAVLSQGGLNAGQPIVQLEMTRKGASVFARVTGMNVHKFLAIVLDNTVYSAPTIRQKITGGSAVIEGRFTMDEAKNLAVVLRAGALPAPANIIELQTVGPSLGQDSIRLGIQASIIGVLAILFFMLFYYRTSGLYAVVALALNALFVLAIMAGINQTLTLPGICGLILNLGMAVDANVLICERIREELAIGKTVRSAIETGYHRVFVVVLDSNLTTLIMGFILLWLGTGPIKGFAITLIFGLIISMFTALFVTHVMYNIFTPRNKTTLSI